MDNSFQSYLLYLELMIFFSGYPLVYALVSFIPGKAFITKSNLNIDTMLVKAYALTGTLYLGLQIRKWYYASDGQLFAQLSLPVVFALLSLVCWLPFLQKRKIPGLLHSLVFFIWLLTSLFVQFASSTPDRDVISNSMKVYTISLLLNACSFLIVWALAYAAARFQQKNIR